MGTKIENERRDGEYDRLNGDRKLKHAMSVISELNGIPVIEGVDVFGEIKIIKDTRHTKRGRVISWVAECPITGFGYFYKSIRDIMKNLNVVITEFDFSTETYTARPAMAGERN